MSRQFVALLGFLTALAAGPAQAQAPIVLEEVAAGLPRITDVAHAGDGSGRLFITQQTGEIVIYDGQEVLPTPFLDISALVSCCGNPEEGLFGMAFHPNYANNGFFYVSYIDNGGDSQISRYSVSGDPNVADAGSALSILNTGQPQPNHNGGQIRFGPDGMLYISLGDGGGSGDPGDNGQDLATLLGSILRIDVDGGVPYAIPADNPFVGVGGAMEEIWAYGLRNPWRFSFDRLTGDLIIADVGQNSIEEVNFQPADSPGGENYGWNIMEGSNCFSPPQNCNQTGLVLPILEYDHVGNDCSITGGFRYRGSDDPQMAGIYFYADYCSGRIWGGIFDGADWTSTELLDTSDRYSTFGEDEDGELYIADYSSSNGRLLRIRAAFPACDVEVNQATYGEGEAVIASVLEFSNFGPISTPVEIKAWLDFGDGSQAGFLNAGAAGTLTFPPGFQTDLAPLPLLPVDAGTPKGSGALSCRFVDPVTGATLSLDAAPFQVQ